MLVGYDLLYCGKENKPALAYSSIHKFVHFTFSLVKSFSIRYFSGTIASKVLKFGTNGALWCSGKASDLRSRGSGLIPRSTKSSVLERDT